MFSQNEFADCIPVGFLFHVLPLIFTSLAANISHFLTTAKKFSCCVSNDICLLCFLSLALALSLLSTSAQTLKFSEKKRLGFVVVFFSIKGPLAKMTVTWTSVIIRLNSTGCRLHSNLRRSFHIGYLCIRGVMVVMCPQALPPHHRITKLSYIMVLLFARPTPLIIIPVDHHRKHFTLP